jgi:DNA-binding response OmpR family regulator
MRRIIILDADHVMRSALVERVLRTANTEARVVADETELVSEVQSGLYSAVFADADLLDMGAPRLIDAVRSAPVRPMLVVASNARVEELDPDLVTLVVRKPYDVLTVTGVLLSAALEVTPAPPPDTDAPTVS